MARQRQSREEYLAEREQRVEAMTEAMSDRVAAIATGPEARELVAFAAQFRSRSPRNAMLIYTQWEARNETAEQPIPRPSMVAGYKQFQEMGRQVRKGEKGYEILAPVTARFASEHPDDPSAWRRLAPREKPGPGETVQSRMVGVKPATVFDIAQTDGPELPALPSWEPLAPGVVPPGLREAVVAEIQREGFTIVDGSTGQDRGGAEGVTNFTERTVTYNGEQPENEQVATLLHELGHVKLHGPDHPGEKLAVPIHRGQEEFEAETFAHVVAGLHGMETQQSSDAYAAGWTLSATGADPSRVAEMTTDAAQRVMNVVNDTVERMPVGGTLSDGGLPTKEEQQSAPKRTAQETRVRNALRMEAQAPARIREESPVDEGPRPTLRAHR